MIKIMSIEDLTKLEGQDILLVKFLKLYLKDLNKQYECETLSKHGSLFLAENISDIENHQQIGLSQPIIKSTYEFAEILTLTDEIREIMNERVFDKPIRERGIELVSFSVESVTLDEESEKKARGSWG